MIGLRRAPLRQVMAIMGKLMRKSPYSKRAPLVAAMDDKAARRSFTSWDDEGDAANAERVILLGLGARPGTKDY